MLLADLDDCQFGDNVEFGEVLAQSKLQNGRTLRFSAWLKSFMAGARWSTRRKRWLDLTSRILCGFTGMTRISERPLSIFRTRFPNLFGLSLDVDADLNWMADVAFGYWPEVLPAARAR